MPIDKSRTQQLLPIFTAALLAVIGVQIFIALAFPLPWLLGSIFPLLIACQFDQIKLSPAKSLIHPSRGILGIAIGGSFTPAVLESLDLYLLSLAFLIPFLVVVILIGKLYYHRIIGFDKNTSVFCALPGGLLEMTLICEEHGANIKQVLLTHTTRVLLIIYGIPFFLQIFTDIDLSGNIFMPGASGEIILNEMLLVFISAIAGWWLAQYLGLSGASIVGPMIACAVIYILGFSTYKLPGELINLAQLILGIRIGLSFKGVKANEMGKNILAATGLFLVLMFVVFITSLSVNAVTDIPIIATFLAFVPGGQAEMNIIAITVGLHIPYIALHHVSRMFLVIAFAPTIIKLAAR